MADLGTDAGGATLNMSAKALELLARLLSRILKIIENTPARRKAMLEYKLAKSEEGRRDALQKINGKAGLVRQKEMKATGKTIMNVETRMNYQDMKLFSDIAKRYDLPFYGLKVEGSDMREIMIFREYLYKYERAHARFTNEKLLNVLQKEIDYYESQDYESLSDDEKDKLETLKKQKQDIIDGIEESFNAEMKDSILRDAVFDEEGNLKKFDLEEGLNRLTGYNLSKPESGDFIIADAINPNNYIKVHGYDDSFINEAGKKIDYVRSEYEVYKNKELVEKFDDRRYVGRPKNYWSAIRGRMDNILENPKYYFKFKTEDSYKAWASDVLKQNEQELNNVSISKLKYELVTKGFEYENGNAILKHNEVDKEGNVIPEGQVIDKEFIVKIIGQGNSLTTVEQRLDFKEAFLTAQMIESLEKANDLEEKLGLKNAEIIVEDDPARKAALQEEYANMKSKLDAEKDNIEAIKAERMKINAAQAERNVANGKTRDNEKREDEHVEENSKTYAQQTPDDWQNEINRERRNPTAKNKDVASKGMEQAKENIKKTSEQIR